jgi:hypothetical protein
MARVRKQLARDRKGVRAPSSLSSSSSSSSVRSLGGKARRQAREKLLRRVAAEGPVIHAKLVLPRRSPPKDIVAEERAKWARWQEEQQARKRRAAAKIQNMLRAKVFRKKVAARIAEKKLRDQRKRVSSLKAKLRRVQEKAAARRIARTLRRAVVRRRQFRAQAKRATEELAQATHESASFGAAAVGGNGLGQGGRLSSSSSSSSSSSKMGTSSAMRVLARAVARRMGARKAKLTRRTGKRCPRGSRRIRRTGFCGTKSLIAALPRLPRRRQLSPGPDAPKDIDHDLARHCPKGYRRLRRRQDGKRVKVAVCRKRSK